MPQGQYPSVVKSRLIFIEELKARAIKDTCENVTKRALRSELRSKSTKYTVFHPEMYIATHRHASLGYHSAFA